ncbi:MAG: hypothetical protein K0B87_05180 [Candidatus Syntrophosphaera sp.]|nr:hypothetical protein [Candidatus Syntrophosphaera sp.]
MNIAYHYFATKTLAVLAGFSEPEAHIIAYACQYVDEAQESEPITIYGLPEPSFERMKKDELDPTCTGHKGLLNILYNFDDVRRKVLLPFHFMPAGWNAAHTSFNYLTKAESPPALELVRLALQKLRTTAAGSPFRDLELIRLGVALHTYEDTFAHQNFSARNSKQDNAVKNPQIRVNGRVRKLPAIFVITGFLGYSIGHGLIGTFPDRFNTRINYFDGRGKSVSVNTSTRFKTASRQVYSLLREYTQAPDDWDQIWPRYKHCQNRDQSSRSEIRKTFSTVYPEIDYQYHSLSWRHRAIKPYQPGTYVFNGDLKWIHFHHAAWDQRQYVLSFLP